MRGGRAGVRSAAAMKERGEGETKTKKRTEAITNAATDEDEESNWREAPWSER